MKAKKVTPVLPVTPSPAEIPSYYLEKTVGSRLSLNQFVGLK